MAGSGPDLINASLGAAFGGAVGPLVDKVIEGLKFVYHCPEQCTALREALERIQPSLIKISDQYQKDPAMKNWLDAFGKCVQEAEEVLKKCESESPSIWDGINKVKYGGEILKLRDGVKELVMEAALVLLAHQSKSSVGPCGIVQQVPGKILGMEDHFRRVKSSVIEGHKSGSGSCVGIRGMGGAGKTLLAKMVNNDEEVQHVFGKESIIWITVGRDASIRAIYEQMRNRLQVGTDGGSLEDQCTHLTNEFSSRRVLLILDDVWDVVHEYTDMVEWLDIAKGPGSVTVLTTREESITSKCVNAGVEIILGLSEEQSWELFCTHAFGTDTVALDKGVEGLARDVCKECKCLPLAVKVIGVAMKGKREMAEWRKTLQHLRDSTMAKNRSVEKQLFKRLQISYDDLDEPTKICFLYFAAFPEDCEIPLEYLCGVWVAEGLFGDELDEKVALDEARCAVNEMLRRSLIEGCSVDGSGEVRCVKMHDILRDLAIHMTREGDECGRESLFRMERKDLEEFPAAWLRLPLKVKRMSLWGNRMTRFPKNFNAPELRVCMLYREPWRAGYYGGGHNSEECIIGEEFFKNLHALRYLQLCENESLGKLPESIGGLGSLQHLNLWGCNALKELQESIRGLGSLQHLNLEWCSALEQLLESIGGLRSLQHLNLILCDKLEQLPESIGGLGSLQHFNFEE